MDEKAPIDGIRVYEVNPDQIRPDPENPNKGTERGDWALEESLDQYGSVRGGALDRDNVIMAGNKSASKAIERGHRVVVVETDGETYVFTKRKDMALSEGGKARAYSVADNRIAQTNLDWDVEVLVASAHDDQTVDVSYMWMPQEWAELEEQADQEQVDRDSGRAKKTREPRSQNETYISCVDCKTAYPVLGSQTLEDAFDEMSQVGWTEDDQWRCAYHSE